MEFIAHRINTIEALKKVPKNYGVELDLRDYKDNIILNHDPFSDGELFEDYLDHYQHGTMILNIKSERIESQVLKLLKNHNIKNYFFLDSSFPMIYALSETGEKNIAIRFSEYETLDSVITMASRVNWVWVDCFQKLPITKKEYNILKDKGLNLCLVSPELQNRDQEIEIYKKYLQENNIFFDAICTKVHNIKRWL